MAKRTKRPPTPPLPNPRTAQQPPALSGTDLVRMLMNPLQGLQTVGRSIQRNRRGRGRIREES